VSTTRQPKERKIPISFSELEATPVLLANVMFVQRFGEEYVVAIGQIAPPILVGTPAEQKHRVDTLGELSVRPVARVSLTRARLEEFIKVLQDGLNLPDAMHG